MINGLLRDDVIAVNNLKHAWHLVFESVDRPIDIAHICRLNQVVGANLICDSGYLRKVPVRMGGTSWVPDMPIESQIKEELQDIMDIPAATDRAITLMLWSMRRQMFPDGNKRTSMLAANQVMIQNGCGVISVPIEKQERFKELLVRFYETNDMAALKTFFTMTVSTGSTSRRNRNTGHWTMKASLRTTGKNRIAPDEYQCWTKSQTSTISMAGCHYDTLLFL